MEQVLIGVERLVSNDLTAIVLAGADEHLELARCRVGFGYAAEVGRRRAGRRSRSPRSRELLDGRRVRRGRRPAVRVRTVRLGARRGAPGGRPPHRLRGARERHPRVLHRRRTPSGCRRSPTWPPRRSPTPASPGRRPSWPPPRSASACRGNCTTPSTRRSGPPRSRPTACSARSTRTRELHGRIERLRQLTRGAQAEMRTLLLELRPHELAEIELHELLEQLIAAMECRKRMQVTAQLQPVELGATERVMLYRIAQEALTNMTRHSAASAVSITLEQRKAHDGPGAGTVMLRVADNGRGFDVDGVAPGHLGLSIMRERAEADRRRSAHLRTAPGHGTELHRRPSTVNERAGERHRSGCWWSTTTTCSAKASARACRPSTTSRSSARRRAARTAWPPPRLIEPDVVVIDLIMPGMGGVEAIRRMRSADPSVGLLALSTFASGDLIRETIAAGASGYLVKSVDTEGLAQGGARRRRRARVVLVRGDPGARRAPRGASGRRRPLHRPRGRGGRSDGRRPQQRRHRRGARTSACSRSRTTSAAS